MFFDNLKDLENIARRTATAIFVVKDGQKIGNEVFGLQAFAKKLKNASILEPEGSKSSKSKSFYGVDQMREISKIATTHQFEDVYFIFDQADKFREDAENAILKLVEEPRKKCHYIFITPEPNALLQTIRSRAKIYQPRLVHPLSTPPSDDPKVMELAKKLLTAKPQDLADIADTLSKKKEDVRREYALAVLATTIDLAMKSYFKTKNKAFTKKIPGLIAAYENIKQNGNLKLQLVAALA